MSEKTAQSKSPKPATESADFFRYVFESHPLPMWIYDLKTLAFLEVNEAALEKYGYSRAEFLKMTLKDIRPAEDAKKKRPALQHSGEWRHRLKDGSIINVEINSHAIAYNGREAALVTAQDITERMRAEEAIRRAEKRSSTLIENAPDGIVFVSTNGKFTYASPATHKLFGYDTDELSQLDPNILTHPDDLPRVLTELSGVIQNPSLVTTIQYRFRHKDGRWLWIESTFSNLIAEPSIQAIVINFRDITERKQMEEALRESEDKFKYFFEHSTVGKSLTLPTGEINANQALCDMLGYTLPEFKNKKWQEITHPEDIELTQREVDQLLSGKRDSARFIKRFIHKDGSVVWVDLNSSIRRDADSKPLYLMTSVIDITARVQAEDALRKNEAQLRNILDATPFPIALVDVQDNNIEFWSQSALTLFGHTAPTTTEWYEIAYPDPDYRREVIGKWKPILEKVRLSSQATNAGEYRITCRDGSVRICELYAAFVADKLIVTFNDITERKQMEDVLRENEERFRTIANYAVSWESWFGPDGKYIWVNPGVEHFTGYSAQEILAMPDFISTVIAEEDRSTFIKRFQEAIHGGRGENFEFRYLHKNGVRGWLSASWQPIYDAQGNPLGTRSSGYSITERKQAEKKLAQYSEHLEELVTERTRALTDAQEQLVRHERLAVLGQLAGGVGHELRNPLAVINNAAYYLKLIQPDADGKIKEYLGLIERETHNAEKIISDLLDFSRVKSADREPVSVSELVQRVLARFPAPESVEVTLDIPNSLPQVFADPRQMEQVLGNLVVNACQAMPGGGELVISGQCSVISENTFVAISVRDTGVGIPPENMNKLFEPLFTTKAKGIGLGLAVSQKLAEANGGRIEVQSEPGAGSTFTLWLPVFKKAE